MTSMYILNTKLILAMSSHSSRKKETFNKT